MAVREIIECDMCGDEIKNRPGFPPWRGTATTKTPRIRLLCHWDRNDPYAYADTEYVLCEPCYERARALLQGKGCPND